jgi:hypothetical protein
VGVPIGYVVLQALGIIVTDTLLWGCVAAPTVLWLIASAIGRFRPWLVGALVGAAIGSIGLVLGVVGGIGLIAAMFSDPT